MKNKFFLLLTVLSFCLGINRLRAQTSDAQYFVPSVYPKSPNVASFTKYGDYQVNLYTGLPDISIPIYTIDAGGLKLPLTLSYHASGIKVTDVASWVGLGWSLAGGGAVSRRIIGGADDGVYGYLTTYVHSQSMSMKVDSDMLYVDNIANGLYDGRPDIYSYDFPGHSGKFFFDGTNKFKPAMIPFSPVNVKYTYVAPNGSTVKALTNFTLTDEGGNLFKFGDSATEFTSTSGAGNNSSSNEATSWMMENMISQNRRDTISFAYSTDNVAYPDVTSQMQVLTDQIGYYGAGGNGPYSPSNVPGPTTSIVSTVAEKPMQQINFKNGKVVFEQDSLVRKDISGIYGLKDIKVYAYNFGSKVMQVQKTVKFYKSYFGTAAANNLRLRLDSIQVLDAAGAIIQHYRFGYNNNITLPAYGNFAKDYWGYYNGKAQSSPPTLIPYFTVPYNGGTTTIGGTVPHNRDCDSNYMQAGMLDTVYYPTGGHTVFTYQTNQYFNNNNVLCLAGGLRVNTISSYDGSGAAPMVKSYKYNTADSNFFLSYHYFAAPPQTHRYYGSGPGGTPQAGAYCTVRNFVTTPTVDLEPFDAAAVVYPSVTEYYGTPANNTGYSYYTYAFESDDTQDASSVGVPVVNTCFYNRGQLLSKSDYLRKNDGTYQAVKSVANSYTAFPQRLYNNVGFVASKMFTNEGGGVGSPLYADSYDIPTDVNSYRYSNYFIYSDDNYLTSSVTTNYDMVTPANYTTSSVNYTYDDTTHQQVIKTIHVDSRGNTGTGVSRYAYNYAPGNAVIDSMVNRHIWAEPIEKYDTLKDAATGVKAIVSGQLNQFKFGSYAGTIVPASVSTLSIPAPLTNFVQSSVSSGTLNADSRYAQMISFDQYDAHNNVTQYTPRNATPTSILWDYQGYLPEAQVKNSKGGTIAQFAYTGFEADVSNGWYLYGKPVIDITAPAGSMSYPLSSGNVIQQTSDNSLASVISLWSKGAAPSITAGSTALTASVLQTANGWTYYEYPLAANYGSITISGSTSIDELRLYPSAAQMTTYSYDPSGLRAEEDTKGANTYFEYDYFQRLKNAKDWQGNIIKNYGYHTYDQTYGNQVQSVSIPRNNCPANYTPGALTYTVPAGRYYSSTQASANTEAAYDMRTNGQAKANANCSCTIQTTAFNFSNSTGISGFTGGTNPVVNFPASGSTPVQVPVGNYSSVYIGPVGSATHTFSFGSQQVTNAHSATFTNIYVTAGSNFTLSIQ